MLLTTVGVRLKVTFHFSATIVARVYGFGFGLVLSSNRLHRSSALCQDVIVFFYRVTN